MALTRILTVLTTLTVIGAAIGAVGMAFGGGKTGLKPGDPAPDFTLPGSDGKTYHLADLQGKTVVLAWFPKAFTGG